MPELLTLFSYVDIAELRLFHVLTADVAHADVAVEELFSTALEAVLLGAHRALDLLVSFRYDALAARTEVEVLLPP